MHIELTSRHGDVAEDVRQLIEQKARKLTHIFERVTAKTTMRTNWAKRPPLWRMMTKTPSATDTPARFHGAFHAVD